MTADETPAAPAEDRGQEQAPQQAQEHERAQQQNEYSRLRLAAGIVGRTWLWFLAGCLLVTVVPMLFGWRPYVIESGSMSPRIKVGDIVLSAPAQSRPRRGTWSVGSSSSTTRTSPAGS